MSSAAQLEVRIRELAEERARGDAFEAAVLSWLTSEPDLGLRAAWRWAEWPERVSRGLPGSDDGIDLVCEDADGGLVAIQVKFRSDLGRPISRDEAQKSLSYPAIFNRYLFVSNAWDRTRSATRGLAGEGRLAWALRSELESSAFDWLASFGIPAAPLAPFTPRPHQARAISDAVAALAEPGRAQLRMACGTGKTLTALWITERLGVERALVLAPTLLLLKQLRAEWLREAAVPFAALAVCSSADVGDGSDGWKLDPADIPGEVTTDPARIADFLARPGRRVVFSTYQSSPRIREAHADPAVSAFELAIADEAHKVAGVDSARDGRTRAQRTILDAGNIRADRRLFLTATPRVYGPGRRRQLEQDFGAEVASMDDETVFGPVAHEFGFRAAVDAHILADYRLVVTVADDEAAARAIRERRFLNVAGRPVDADQVATAIAIRRAVDELGLRRVISFHSTIARARAFAGLLIDVPFRGVLPEARWISGAQPVRDRELVLSELREPKGAVVVSNARCLTEGIDVPALDAVAFADPRRSPIDLVQAIGRAMRAAEGKSIGWVIVPVHLGPDELADPEAAVESSAFEPVIAVLRALRSHDPLLATDAARIRLSLGPRPTAGDLAAGLDDVRVDLVGPAGVALGRLLAAIRLRAIDVSADSWATGLAALRAFVAREGHAQVPPHHVEGALRLGEWVNYRRVQHRAGQLDPEHVAQLAALSGWSWDPRIDNWAAALAALRKFVEREGHARVPYTHIENRIPLGTWATSRRIEHSAGRLDPARAAELEAIPGWTWDPIADDWTAMILALRSFATREGHARISASYVEGELRLGEWVNSRRVEHRAGRLDPARVPVLEAVPGWTWDPRADDWNTAMAALRAFAVREGHTRIPRGHIEGGVTLGSWVISHRSRRGRLDPARVAELEAVPGWTWDPQGDDWEAAVIALRAFVAREGHARVPGDHVEGELRLGRWVFKRRTARNAGRLDPTRAAELEAVQGWTWDPYGDDWEAGLAALRTFASREGHARVPQSHVEGHFRLGSWVSGRRVDRNRGRLDPERVIALEAVPGWGWDPIADEWNANLAALRALVEREGHARARASHTEGDRRLGRWVSHQRSEYKRGRLDPARAAELEALPGWSWSVELRPRVQSGGEG
jgi:superfamily II DNA or RNA helicase